MKKIVALSLLIASMFIIPSPSFARVGGGGRGGGGARGGGFSGRSGGGMSMSRGGSFSRGSYASRGSYGSRSFAATRATSPGYTGTRFTGRGVAGTRVAGTRMAGTRLAGTRVAGARMGRGAFVGRGGRRGWDGKRGWDGRRGWGGRRGYWGGIGRPYGYWWGDLGLLFGTLPFIAAYDWSDYYEGSDYVTIVNNSDYIITVGTYDGAYLGNLRPGETTQLPYANQIVFERQGGKPFAIGAEPNEAIEITDEMVQ